MCESPRSAKVNLLIVEGRFSISSRIQHISHSTVCRACSMRNLFRMSLKNILQPAIKICTELFGQQCAALAGYTFVKSKKKKQKSHEARFQCIVVRQKLSSCAGLPICRVHFTIWRFHIIKRCCTHNMMQQNTQELSRTFLRTHSTYCFPHVFCRSGEVMRLFSLNFGSYPTTHHNDQ